MKKDFSIMPFRGKLWFLRSQSSIRFLKKKSKTELIGMIFLLGRELYKTQLPRLKKLPQYKSEVTRLPSLPRYKAPTTNGRKKKRKFSAKQLAAQRLFAKRAKAGTLRRRRR